VESNWVNSARRPQNGLLYLPRVIMRIENLVEWWLAGEIEVLGENLPQRHFVHHKFHITWLGANPGRRGGSQRLTAWATARSPLILSLFEEIPVSSFPQILLRILFFLLEWKQNEDFALQNYAFLSNELCFDICTAASSAGGAKFWIFRYRNRIPFSLNASFQYEAWILALFFRNTPIYEHWANYTIKNCVICTFRLILLGSLKQGIHDRSIHVGNTNAYRISVANSKVKKALMGTRSRCWNNIKTDLKRIECQTV
jgi:hypothetical protein